MSEQEYWAIKGPDEEILPRCCSYSKAQSLSLFMDYFYGSLKDGIKPEEWETICNKRDCEAVKVKIVEFENDALMQAMRAMIEAKDIYIKRLEEQVAVLSRK
jgi:phosphoribosylpyrophosphate synthetase